MENQDLFGRLNSIQDFETWFRENGVWALAVENLDLENILRKIHDLKLVRKRAYDLLIEPENSLISTSGTFGGITVAAIGIFVDSALTGGVGFGFTVFSYLRERQTKNTRLKLREMMRQIDRYDSMLKHALEKNE